MAFVEGFSLKIAFFPVSRGKNHVSQGVENRGSLVSMPLAALRAITQQYLHRWQLVAVLVLGQGRYPVGFTLSWQIMMVTASEQNRKLWEGGIPFSSPSHSPFSPPPPREKGAEKGGRGEKGGEGGRERGGRGRRGGGRGGEREGAGSVQSEPKSEGISKKTNWG